jgi:hypothetical protein
MDEKNKGRGPGGLPLADRPLWLNALLAFCVYVTFIYSPWDYFSKPVAEAEDVWLGYVFRGEAARLTEPIHFLVYLALTWGLWQMRPWMRFWGTVYMVQLTIAFGVWGILDDRGHWLMAPASLVIWGLLTWAYWRAAVIFLPESAAASSQRAAPESSA